jgi:hypothetical protein
VEGGVDDDLAAVRAAVDEVHVDQLQHPAGGVRRLKSFIIFIKKTCILNPGGIWSHDQLTPISIGRWRRYHLTELPDAYLTKSYKYL